MPRRARKRRSDKASPQMDREACRKELEKLKMERIMRRQYLRHKATQQFHKSMQMLSGNAKYDDDKTPFEDYSIFVYRQTAPDFRDRVKELEMKILYPDKEQRLLADVKRGAMDQDFSGRVKHIEDKLKGVAYDKKPKDLNRAIGKIEKSDWNVKEIEKKITENKFGRSSKGRTEPKVPKWSREQYEDKVRRLMKDEDGNSKYAEIEDKLKRIERKMKEGSVPEPGKVSAMAAHLANMNQEPEKPVLQKSNSKAALNLPTTGGSEICHFCAKRVYVMERFSAEGKFFHRGCFRCEYCKNSLRPGNYSYDRDGKFGSQFFCVHHYGMTRTRREEQVNNKENIPSHPTPKTPVMMTQDEDMNDQGATPERIEFENLSGVGETASDHEDAEISEMDEEEWTDRNFGASAAEVSSDEASDLSDSDEEEAYAEALDVGVGMTKDETLRLAETWTRRHGNNTETAVDNDEESGSCHDSDDSRDRFSYQEYDSEDDESETATEGEEDVKARELRRQEVHLEAPDIETDSDTEVNNSGPNTGPSVTPTQPPDVVRDSRFTSSPELIFDTNRTPSPPVPTPRKKTNSFRITSSNIPLSKPKIVVVQKDDCDSEVTSPVLPLRKSTSKTSNTAQMDNVKSPIATPVAPLRKLKPSKIYDSESESVKTPETTPVLVSRKFKSQVKNELDLEKNTKSVSKKLSKLKIDEKSSDVYDTPRSTLYDRSSNISNTSVYETPRSSPATPIPTDPAKKLSLIKEKVTTSPDSEKCIKSILATKLVKGKEKPSASHNSKECIVM